MGVLIAIIVATYTELIDSDDGRHTRLPARKSES